MTYNCEGYRIVYKGEFTYLIGNPKVLPSFVKTVNATALKINPMPDKIVSIMSRTNGPKALQ